MKSDRQRSMKLFERRNWLKLFVSCLFVTLVVGCSQNKPQFNSIDITGADYATGFKLTDHNGAERSLSDFKGKVTVVFFGYTHCPDVCPTTLSEMVQVRQMLGEQGKQVQTLFVTLDPARDTADFLKDYVTSFDAEFIGFVPTQKELPELAKAFKIYYQKVDGPTPTSYTIDHTAGSYVYDTQGRVRLFTRYGTGPKLLAQDIALLLNEH